MTRFQFVSVSEDVRQDYLNAPKKAARKESSQKSFVSDTEVGGAAAFPNVRRVLRLKECVFVTVLDAPLMVVRTAFSTKGCVGIIDMESWRVRSPAVYQLWRHEEKVSNMEVVESARSHHVLNLDKLMAFVQPTARFRANARTPAVPMVSSRNPSASSIGAEPDAPRLVATSWCLEKRSATRTQTRSSVRSLSVLHLRKGTESALATEAGLGVLRQPVSNMCDELEMFAATTWLVLDVPSPTVILSLNSENFVPIIESVVNIHRVTGGQLAAGSADLMSAVRISAAPQKRLTANCARNMGVDHDAVFLTVTKQPTNWESHVSVMEEVNVVATRSVTNCVGGTGFAVDTEPLGFDSAV